jgi:toxin HigB-1
MEIKIEDHFLGEVAVVKELKELRGKLPFPVEVLQAFRERISYIKAAKDTSQLRKFKSWHFEKLKEPKYLGKYSIRLNKAYRMIFRIEHNEIKLELICIEEVNNHYS